MITFSLIVNGSYRPPISSMLVVLMVEISYIAAAHQLVLAVPVRVTPPDQPVYFAEEGTHFAWCTSVPIAP